MLLYSCSESKNTRPIKNGVDAGYQALCGLHIMKDDAGGWAVDDYLGRIVPDESSDSRWLCVLRKTQLIKFDIDGKIVTYSIAECILKDIHYAALTKAGSTHPELLIEVTYLGP